MATEIPSVHVYFCDQFPTSPNHNKIVYVCNRMQVLFTATFLLSVHVVDAINIRSWIPQVAAGWLRQLEICEGIWLAGGAVYIV